MGGIGQKGQGVSQGKDRRGLDWIGPSQWLGAGWRGMVRVVALDRLVAEWLGAVRRIDMDWAGLAGHGTASSKVKRKGPIQSV